jgi:2-dehydro-3-deoxygluconokinase
VTVCADATGALTGPEVVCVGEAMAMVVPETTERLRVAKSFQICVAGAESNVAMYLSALGHHAAWAGRVGADPLGQRVLEQIAWAGVDVSLAEQDPDAPTGVFFKDPGHHRSQVYYYRRDSAAARMSRAFIDRMRALRPQLVHVSGITPALSPSCAQLVSAMISGRIFGDARVSFDVNFRPPLWQPGRAAKTLLSLAQAADIVFVGMDEARLLWGTRYAADVRAMVGRKPVLVVKDGANGAVEYSGEAETFCRSLQVKVVEPTGAGDAFAAGWLAGELGGLPASQRLRLGHLVAASAMSSAADVAPLPSRLDLANALCLDDEHWGRWPPPTQTGSARPDRRIIGREEKEITV